MKTVTITVKVDFSDAGEVLSLQVLAPPKELVGYQESSLAGIVDAARKSLDFPPRVPSNGYRPTADLSGKSKKAADFLADFLSGGNPVSVREIYPAGASLGFSANLLRKVAKLMKLKTERSGWGTTGTVSWSLPTNH